VLFVFLGLDFALLGILNEAQAIKNPAAKSHGVVPSQGTRARKP
jgi:hypothetical protein